MIGDMSMEGRKRVKQVEATRQKIMLAAFPLLTGGSYDAVSMEEIALAAAVSRTSLYNHFDDKAAILDACFADEFSAGALELLGRATKISGRRERLAYVFDVFAKWAAPKKTLLLPVVLHGIRQSLAHSHEVHPLQAFFVALIECPASNADDKNDLEMLAHYLRHMYLAATLRWLASEEPGPEMFFAEMLSLFLDGAEVKRGTT
ncbi:TetR/AcrR family transcriptional regulator [Aquitalea palustris]|uniref:TetR/AcrR family transcriptional regulator n=2 Tax=Aquitalea palustris TaxID=2480983 RepID=A0A454JDD6_9NEIS|nr:TetR/AcrR family transcriptional regulator [Aquitalea palustris]